MSKETYCLKKKGVKKKESKNSNKEIKSLEKKRGKMGEKRKTSHDIARTLEVSEGLLVLFLFFFFGRVGFDGIVETYAIPFVCIKCVVKCLVKYVGE